MTKRKATAAESLDLRKLARGEACTGCGRNDGTVVLAHYSGLRQHQYGKGRGIKGNDWMAAPQCAQCHKDGAFAEGWDGDLNHSDPMVRKIDKSEEQLHQIALWHASLAERGII